MLEEETLGFSASPRKLGGVTVIDVRGRLTLYEGHALCELVQDLMSDGQTKLLLNLESVTQLDSAGLGTLVRSSVSVMRRGGNLKVTHQNPRVTAVLTVTNLQSVLPAYPDERSALASFVVS